MRDLVMSVGYFASLVPHWRCPSFGLLTAPTLGCGSPKSPGRDRFPEIGGRDLGKKYGSMNFDDQSAADLCAKTFMGPPDRPNTPLHSGSYPETVI
jgi:hypothetical protein